MNELIAANELQQQWNGEQEKRFEYNDRGAIGDANEGKLLDIGYHALWALIFVSFVALELF